MYTAGLYCYAAALIGFGMIHILNTRLMKALFPGIVSAPWLVYGSGVVFIIAGIGLFILKRAKQAALMAALVYASLLVYPHLLHLISDLYDPNEWTVFFQLVACCAGALLIAGSMAGRIAWMIAAGRYAFAVSLAIFGIQHFLYAGFIQTLIPSWIPVPVLWSWLIRIAFIFTASSIVLNIITRTTGMIAGLMFFLWIFLFHIPRIVADAGNESEWTGLFMAAAIGGVCLLVTDDSITLAIKKKYADAVELAKPYPEIEQ